MKKTIVLLLLVLVAGVIFSCVSTQVDPIMRDNDAFLNSAENEAFRVVMMSDFYKVSQGAHSGNIARDSDESGDQYFMDRISKLKVVDEAREGHIKVWVYPDSGRLMKVRFLESTYIQELDQLIIDDIQRWTFSYSKGIYPLVFTVRYRIVLRTNQ